MFPRYPAGSGLSLDDLTECFVDFVFKTVAPEVESINFTSGVNQISAPFKSHHFNYLDALLDKDANGEFLPPKWGSRLVRLDFFGSVGPSAAYMDAQLHHANGEFGTFSYVVRSEDDLIQILESMFSEDPTEEVTAFYVLLDVNRINIDVAQIVQDGRFAPVDDQEDLVPESVNPPSSEDDDDNDPFDDSIEPDDPFDAFDDALEAEDESDFDDDGYGRDEYFDYGYDSRAFNAETYMVFLRDGTIGYAFS